MQHPKDKNWFNDIDPPAGLGDQGSSTGYLDRLFVGGDPSQRQYLTAGLKGQVPASRGNTNRKNNSIQTKKPCDKKPLGSKLPSANIDDESWIADRKKKFPKIGGSDQDNDEKPSERMVPPALEPSSNYLADESLAKGKPKPNGSKGPPRRKMTLFEKLTAEDQQSS